jgi:hypothetical protein
MEQGEPRGSFGTSKEQAARFLLSKGETSYSSCGNWARIELLLFGKGRGIFPDDG